jgi:hypothetical protein
VTVVATDPCYLFGIVRADASAPGADAAGPISHLRLIRSGELAALVGRVPDGRALGRGADLRAHDRVLADVVAAGTAVLPIRFGAVLADESTVVADLLEPFHDEFAEALELVSGRVQYTVKARYELDAVLREVVAENPDVAALRGQRASPDEGSAFAAELRLGELVVSALAHKRDADAAPLLTALARKAVDVRVRQPAEAQDVLHAAFLVDRKRGASFERAVESAGKATHGRLRLRLLGPLAAYDFVPEP